MKGLVVLEVAAMVVIAVVIIFVIYNMFVSGPTATKTTVKYEKEECTYHSDCIGNRNGNLCLEGGTPIPAVFCGCLSRANCPGTACGGNNKCIS